MSKAKGTIGVMDHLDQTDKEGHGELSDNPNVKKGTFIGIGTYAPLANEAISPNKKSGTSSGGAQ